MLHQEALDILYRYNYEIKRICKRFYLKSNFEHLSLYLIQPDGGMVFFSDMPSHTHELCKHQYHQLEGILSEKYYKQFEFYWWRDVIHRPDDIKIESIRSDVVQLQHGFVLVRKWNDFHLLYSFAKTKYDIHFELNVSNRLNTFLKIGDHVYEELRPFYANYIEPYQPPKIETFYPFKGGRPPAYYTKEYFITHSGLLVPEETENNIIHFDFSARQRQGTDS